MSDYVDALMQQSAANSAFNAEQAQLNRDWQEYMSSTSHQREVGDLIAAGLNPVLSANSGSTWSSVANGAADPSSAQGLTNLATTWMNNQASIEISKIQADATKAAAGATAAAAMAAAATSASATRYAADRSYETATTSAQISKGSTVAGLVDKYLGGFNAISAIQNASKNFG